LTDTGLDFTPTIGPVFYDLSVVRPWPGGVCFRCGQSFFGVWIGVS
jgi:hypothetical protein